MADDKNTKTTAEQVKSLFEDARKNFQAKKYLNALALCNAARRLATDNLDVVWLLAMTHFEYGTLETEWDTNDTIAACKYFEYLAERDPDRRAMAYLYNGIAIVRWGNNYRIAIENFDKALELDPGNELAAKLRDMCRKCMDGNHAEAQNERNSLLESIQADGSRVFESLFQVG